MDVPSEYYRDIDVPSRYLEYKGFRDITLPLEFFGSFDKSDKWVPSETKDVLTLEEIGLKDVELYSNEFILVRCADTDRLSKKELRNLL